MIANISSGTRYYGVLMYNQIKVNKGDAKILYEYNINSTKPHKLHNYLDRFSRDTNTKKPVFHVSLSFPKTDKQQITDEFLNKISQEYLEKMGYGNQPYIIYRHYDTEHPHVHIGLQQEKKVIPISPTIALPYDKRFYNISLLQKHIKYILKKHDKTVR